MQKHVNLNNEEDVRSCWPQNSVITYAPKNAKHEKHALNDASSLVWTNFDLSTYSACMRRFHARMFHSRFGPKNIYYSVKGGHY